MKNECRARFTGATFVPAFMSLPAESVILNRTFSLHLSSSKYCRPEALSEISILSEMGLTGRDSEKLTLLIPLFTSGGVKSISSELIVVMSAASMIIETLVFSVNFYFCYYEQQSFFHLSVFSAELLFSSSFPSDH